MYSTYYKVIYQGGTDENVIDIGYDETAEPFLVLVIYREETVKELRRRPYRDPGYNLKKVDRRYRGHRRNF